MTRASRRSLGGVVLLLAVFVGSAVVTRSIGGAVLTQRDGGRVQVAGSELPSPSPAMTPTTVASAEPVPSPSPSPAPRPVSARAILAALQQQPLAPDPGIPAEAVLGPEEYVPPGDVLPSARMLGGVGYQIDSGPGNAVWAAILMFEGAQDAQVEVDQELVLSESSGESYTEMTVNGNSVYCSADGVACIAAIGRAALRMAGGADVDVPYVLPAMRASIRTLAAARAEAASGG